MKFVLVICLCLFICSVCSAQTEEDFNWVGRYHSAALREFLPIEQEAGTNIAFRSHQSFYNNVLEYSFILSKDYPTNQVTVVVRMADSITLYDQLLALHRRNPSASYESLKSQLRIREQLFSEADCPAIKSLFDRFSQLRFRPPSADLLILHPMIYRIHTNAIAGIMDLSFVEEDNALVAWALSVRRTLEGCARRTNRQRQIRE